MGGVQIEVLQPDLEIGTCVSRVGRWHDVAEDEASMAAVVLFSHGVRPLSPALVLANVVILDDERDRHASEDLNSIGTKLTARAQHSWRLPTFPMALERAIMVCR